MSSYLKHFTVMGDDLTQWYSDYEKWEKEEMEYKAEKMTPDTVIKVEYGYKPPSFQETMKKVFQSHKFQVLVVCLALTDATLVLVELLLDVKIIYPDKDRIIAKVFHYVSLSILFLFMVEVSFKLFTYHLEFLKHKFEVLDALIIFISFVLDIALLFQNHELEALGLLILFRLWRVARIINGIILSVKTESEQHISKLKKAKRQLAAKVQELESSCAEKEQEIERLKKLLEQHQLFSQLRRATPVPAREKPWQGSQSWC